MNKKFLVVGLFLGLAQLQFAQSGPANAADDKANAPAAAAAPSDNAVPTEGLLSRWLEIDTFSSSLRYRNTSNSGGFHPFHFGQHRELLDGRFKFDKEGKYSINFHGSSGRYFNWAYADMLEGQFTDGVPHAGPFRPLSVSKLIGIALKADPNSPYPQGIESRGAYFYLRQLYFSATPVKQATFQYGSLGIDHGENSEITSFDDDGYISGGRVKVHDPEHLFVDEVEGTWAYLGGALTPNFFDRGSNLKELNYQQYMLRKKFGRFHTSVDFTKLRSTSTMREGLVAKVPEMHVIDTARLELYQRTNLTTLYGLRYGKGAGFAITGSKTMFQRLTLEVGYAHVDQYYGVYTGDPFLIAVGFSWNSDSFMCGTKAFTRGSLKIAPGVSLFGFFAHEVSPYQYFITNHATANGGITFSLDDWMHKAHII